MKAAYTELIWKAFLSLTFILCIGIVAIHERLNVAPLDKAYPTILFLSIAYLHWIAWELLFAFLGVPAAIRKQVRIRKQHTISVSGLLIAFGYVILALTIVNHLISPTHSQASDMISASIKSIAAGVFIQMIFTTRYLVSNKFKNETGA